MAEIDVEEHAVMFAYWTDPRRASFCSPPLPQGLQWDDKGS